MGGKNDSPDYAAGAAAQGEANEDVVRQQTYANRPTQYTPWGATSWDAYGAVDPSSGEDVTRWKQNQMLSPELQDIFNKQVGIQGGRTDVAGALTQRLGNEYGGAINWQGLNPMGQVPTNQFTLPENQLRNLDYNGAPGVTKQYSNAEPLQRDMDYSGAPGVGDLGQMRQRAEDSVYGKAQSRLAPQYESKRNALESKLRNQGLQPQDESWKAQMQAIGQQETDAYGQAQYDAVNQGMGEQAQDYGQQMGLRNMATSEADRMGNFRNQASGQAFGQQMGANQQNFGQDMALRNMATGEARDQANFANDASNQAYNQAYGANQANFGQAMQSSQYANQIRQQQMTEAMQKRGYGLNEINALLSGQQVQAPQMPNFSQAASAQPAPIYQSNVDQGNFDQASSPMGGLMDIAGMAAGGYASTLGG